MRDGDIKRGVQISVTLGLVSLRLIGEKIIRGNRFTQNHALYCIADVGLFFAEVYLHLRQSPASSKYSPSLLLEGPEEQFMINPSEALSWSFLILQGTGLCAIPKGEYHRCHRSQRLCPHEVFRNQCELRRGAGLGDP